MAIQTMKLINHTRKEFYWRHPEHTWTEDPITNDPRKVLCHNQLVRNFIQAGDLDKKKPAYLRASRSKPRHNEWVKVRLCKYNEAWTVHTITPEGKEKFVDTYLAFDRFIERAGATNSECVYCWLEQDQ